MTDPTHCIDCGTTDDLAIVLDEDQLAWSCPDCIDPMGRLVKMYANDARTDNGSEIQADPT